MEITFKKSLTGNEEYSINLLQTSKTELYIQLKRESFINDKEITQCIYLIDKDQLHDFIGALLHIQQKMR